MTIIRILLISFLSLWLMSCATVPTTQTQPTTPVKAVSWDNRVKTLSTIEDWNLKALIAIRNQSDAGSATMQWKQQKQNYHISLYGPLGTAAFELTGQPGKVELASSDGQHFYADTPESLLAQRTGWQLPVSNLFYWIRGLPAPNLPAEKNLDSNNHLVALKQNGWMIQFLRYTSVNGVDIPDKIFLDNPQMNVKIIVKQWQF